MKDKIDGLVQTAVTPVCKQWSYCSLALSHRRNGPHNSPHRNIFVLRWWTFVLRLGHLCYSGDTSVMVDTFAVIMNIRGKLKWKGLDFPPVHILRIWWKTITTMGLMYNCFLTSLSAFYYMNCPHCNVYVHTITVHIMIECTIHILKSQKTINTSLRKMHQVTV